jgi:hypothetical protein
MVMFATIPKRPGTCSGHSCRRWVVPILVLAVSFLSARTAPAQEYPRHAPAGSTFQPIDSWVYPVFERLVAQDLVRSASMGIKPWTRSECARLTEEASDRFRERLAASDRRDELTAQMIEALEREFAHELVALGGGRNRSLAVDSLYARGLSVSGPALTDGYHFGQTVAYDFGRPFRRGTNLIAGGAARATLGRFAFHIGGEFQHAPSAPPLSDAVLDLISDLDLKPRETPRRFAPINRARWMETYVSLNISNWQLSVGTQSLSWGVGSGESLIMSHNAEPLPMVRLTRVMPRKLPSLLGLLGPVRVESFATRLQGATFVPHPFLYGGKVSFKPHPRFEMTFARTQTFGGRGHPVTFRTFFYSLFGVVDHSIKPIPTAPGDDRDAMDFTFQLGRDLYLYFELYQEDSPIFFITPTRAAYRPGIFWASLPRAPRLDLRVEVSSTFAASQDRPARNNYWNFQYHDGYTHEGFLIGSATGRAGRSILVHSNYWLSPKEALSFQFRASQVQKRFLPGGASWQDVAVLYRKRLLADLFVHSSLRLQHIRSYPALFTGSRTNVTAAVELRYSPENSLRITP